MRKRRRGIWLFRLQPLAEGTLIVFNALFIYVLFQLASVLVMTAYKAMEYRTYIRRHLLPKHIILMQSLILYASCYYTRGRSSYVFPYRSMAAIVSAWCYIFANIGGAMQLRSHGRRLVPANRRGIILHNVCLAVLIIAYVAANSVGRETLARCASLLITPSVCHVHRSAQARVSHQSRSITPSRSPQLCTAVR